MFPCPGRQRIAQPSGSAAPHRCQNTAEGCQFHARKHRLDRQDSTGRHRQAGNSQGRKHQRLKWMRGRLAADRNGDAGRAGGAYKMFQNIEHRLRQKIVAVV